MSDPLDTGLPSTEPPQPRIDHAVEEWARRFIAAWTSDRSLSAARFVGDHPEIAGDGRLRGILTYEEFCQRVESGEPVDSEVFSQQLADDEEAQKIFQLHWYLRSLSPDGSSLSPDGNAVLAGLQAPTVVIRRPPPPARVWPKPGDVIGGFELTAVLGKGGFAHVYLAEELALGRRQVVIKASVNGGHEADTLGKLPHANIVPVFSVSSDVESGLTLICMPFLGRVTLSHVLNKLYGAPRPPRSGRELANAIRLADPGGHAESQEPIDRRLSKRSFVDAVVHLGAQLADALEYTNQKGIFHRDLKPSNVLIEASGRPMLLDFNLSYDEQVIRRGWGGTLRYMAPELVKRVFDRSTNEFEVDPRSDIYSLAVILYELLTGFHPCGGVPEKAISLELAADLHARQKQTVTPLGKHNRDVEPELSALIDRCLSFDVERRPRSAAALAGALRRLSSWRGRLWRRAWRHRRMLTVSLVPLVVALGVGGYALSTRPPYGHRQFLKAKQAYAHDDVVATRDYCTDAIEAGERTWGTYSLRARALLHLGEFDLAQEDIENAGRCESHPSTNALLADYQCAMSKWERAIGGYEFAMKNGFETGALLFNIAYANSMSGHRELALPWLDRAIAADGRLGEAYGLRAVVLTHIATQSHQPIPRQVASDLTKAIELLPNRYGLYVNAAMIHAEIAEQNDSAEDRKQAADYTLEALRRGLRVNELPRSGPLVDIIDEIRDSEDFAKAVEAGAHVERVRGRGWVDSLRGTD